MSLSKYITQLNETTSPSLTGFTAYDDSVSTYKVSLQTLADLFNDQFVDITITGGTFSGNTITFRNSTGGTFNVTGITPTDLTITGGTYSNGTMTFTNNIGGTFNVTGITNTDITVTGVTYSGDTITFINNTGGTFNVTGVTSNIKFISLLEQPHGIGEGPFVTECVNTIGSYTMTYISTGFYEIKFNRSLTNKKVTVLSNLTRASDNTNTMYVGYSRETEIFRIVTYSNGVLSDGVISDDDAFYLATIEINIYD